jgi:tetratricopeptide (TPR) repeat protein
MAMDSELTRLRRRVAELRAALPAPGANPDPSIDLSILATELQELLSSARLLSDARPELRQLLILLGRVEFKRGDLAKARDHLIDGLAIDPGTSADANELTRDHYLLAGVAGDLKAFQTAAEHYGKAAQFAKSATDFDANQKLGIRERFAYALHEAKRYAEAYAANLELLGDAERLFGAADHRLSTVLINTAQNLYALKKLAEAQTYLQRALDIAQARSDIEREQDLLYQLAVLASEQGRAVEARRYLAERVERLEQRGPSPLMAAARRSLEHFDRNQARASGRPANPP